MLPVNLINPNMVRYANTPGINGITDGMANIMGGTCLKCAMGKLKIPTAEAPTKDANTTPAFICNKEYFKRHPIAPPIQSGNNVRGGTLNKMPKPSAAQPHQKALLKINIRSIIINSNYK